MQFPEQQVSVNRLLEWRVNNSVVKLLYSQQHRTSFAACYDQINQISIRNDKDPTE
jgi:hypothetical protein